MSKKLFAARWLLILLIAASTMVVAVSAVRLWQENQVNAYIAAPEAFESVPNDPRAQIAYAGLLERQQEHNKALAQLTQMLGKVDESLLPLAYFNRGNISLRSAMNLDASDELKITLVELAKQDYRSALALEPMLWNVRYNLELALLIVPEDPEAIVDFERNTESGQLSIEIQSFKVDLP